MKINTRYFGEIEIDEEKIIDFPRGIIAFEDKKKFIIIENQDENNPFCWLQCIDDPNLAFVIINPFLFKRDYDFEIADNVIEELEIENDKEIVVFSIVVVPDNLQEMTANLLAPIIINTKKRLGKQIILDDKRYKTKHYILKELGEMQNAGVK